MHYKYYTIIVLLSINISYAKTIFNLNDTTKTYEWIVSETDTKELNQLLKKNKKFERKELDYLFNSIIIKLENSGYPFSEINFNTDSVKEYKIYGKLLLKKGPKITIDSIAIKGYNKFPKHLIERYIEIRKNSLYNQSAISNISKKIQEIDFIKEYKKNEILFNNNKNIIYLYLNKEKNNYLDAFLGLNNYNKKIIIIGKMHFNISNALNQFEDIELKWNKSDKESQELNFKIQFPYIFNSIFGINGNLNILQFENTYNKRELSFLLRIKKINNTLSFGYTNKKSSVFSENITASIKDFNSSSIKMKWGKRFTEKYNIDIGIEIGNSNIEKQKYNRKKTSLSFQFLFDFFKNNYLLLKSTNELLIGDNILENEKKSIGGQNYLRGFLDNSFFSKSFNIINLENQYYIEENTYISLFYDFGFLHDNESQIVSSFGIGLGILRKNDIFSINYAIPIQNDKFEIGDAKLHFNYIIKF